MTFRSRLVFGVVATLVVVALAPSSFAQINITVTSIPSASEVQTNRNAQTADPGSSGAGILVSGSVLADASVLTATILRVAYPSPITSSPANCVNSSGSTVFACPNVGTASVQTALIPTADAIRIEGATGVFATVSQARLNTTQSRIEIPLPLLTAPLSATGGSFRLVGVRIDANGKAGAQTATIALDSSANNYILSTASVTVINAIGTGIGTFAIGARGSNTNQGTATIFTNRQAPDPTGSLILTEGFASAFRSATQSSNSGVDVTNGTNIRLTFNGIPAGVTLNLSAQTGTGVTVTVGNPTVTATANTSTLVFTATNLSITDTVEVDWNINGCTSACALSTTAAVTTPATITATATLVPIGDGLINEEPTRLGLPRQDQGYPTFAQADSGPITVVSIIPASTTLLLPYALVLAPYDTGLAVANTTADPFGSSGGGATAQAGTITLNFFPTATAGGGAGTPFSLTTSSTIRPGAGLSSDGTLAAGATWTVLLSQALSAAGQTGNFVGYVFIQTNFLNAHGTATISDFRTYSLAANVLVLSPPQTLSRTAALTGAEQLHF